MVASRTHPDWGGDPLDWEVNPQPFSTQADTVSAEPSCPGWICPFTNLLFQFAFFPGPLLTFSTWNLTCDYSTLTSSPLGSVFRAPPRLPLCFPKQRHPPRSPGMHFSTISFRSGSFSLRKGAPRVTQLTGAHSDTKPSLPDCKTHIHS